jgi:hypothetical protein
MISGGLTEKPGERKYIARLLHDSSEATNAEILNEGRKNKQKATAKRNIKKE